MPGTTRRVFGTGPPPGARRSRLSSPRILRRNGIAASTRACDAPRLLRIYARSRCGPITMRHAALSSFFASHVDISHMTLDSTLTNILRMTVFLHSRRIIESLKGTVSQSSREPNRQCDTNFATTVGQRCRFRHRAVSGRAARPSPHGNLALALVIACPCLNPSSPSSPPSPSKARLGAGYYSWPTAAACGG